MRSTELDFKHLFGKVPVNRRNGISLTKIGGLVGTTDKQTASARTVGTYLLLHFRPESSKFVTRHITTERSPTLLAEYQIDKRINCHIYPSIRKGFYGARYEGVTGCLEGLSVQIRVIKGITCNYGGLLIGMTGTKISEHRCQPKIIACKIRIVGL